MADTIYVRVDSEDKSWLERFAAEHKARGWSQNHVIARLLQYVQKIDPEELQEIIEGTVPRTISKAGSLMEQFAWLQQAFGQRFFHWALELAIRLEKEAAAAGAEDMKKFAQYRAAYCWLDIATELRNGAFRLRELIKQDWPIFFAAADWALCASIAYSEKYSAVESSSGRKPARKSAVGHPVVAFNMACAWSLRSQYYVEGLVGPDPDLVKAISERLNKDREQQLASERSRQFHSAWREDLDQQNPKLALEAEKRVQFRCKKALGMLDLSKTDDFLEPPTDKDFIVRYARRDPDLEFLRSDVKFKDSFKKWAGDSAEHTSFLESFEKAKRNVPDETLRAIAELQPDDVSDQGKPRRIGKT